MPGRHAAGRSRAAAARPVPPGYPFVRERHRHHGPAAARSAHLRDGSLQLPLRLLHAEGGVRPRLQVHGPQGAPHLRGARAARARIRLLRGGEDQDHGRRAVAPPRRRASRRATRGDRGPRRDADDERRPLATEGRGPRRGRPAAHHGQPRLARRCNVSQHERRRLSRLARARGHRRGCSGGPLREGERGRQAWRQRRAAPRPRAALPRQRAHPAFHRVHGRRSHERWRLDDVVSAAEIVARSTQHIPSSRPSRTTVEKWRGAGVIATAKARSG